MCIVCVVVVAMFQLQKHELERARQTAVISDQDGTSSERDALAQLDACKTRLQQFVLLTCH